ncbi:hypothetical protein EYB53_001430 [Candidatus Chloroploca sp. M-50]|uniref:Vitellogenin domain-containing protein n=1 Tax=Candidatus Chloroploca mongolica TaxID=2528176 RepID=A0ABS4D4J1_9CHLR|nr:hypothetical protein [Candidatus Chloroploca mongolica]MBP1464357.1 hypothetical protein [Candidatus Chloroploca mongolica]
MRISQTMWPLTFLLLLSLLIAQHATARTPAATMEARPQNLAATMTPTLAQGTAECAFARSPHTVYLPMLARDRAAPTPQPMTRALQYQIGKTYVYDYQMSNHSLFGTVSQDEGIRAETPSTTLSYGQARISITGQEGADVFVGSIILVSPVLCQQNPAGPDEFVDDPQILTDLLTPMLFKQDTSGAIVEVQVAQGVNPEAANILKGVLNSLQGSLAEENSYTTVEYGGQGVYEAQYTAVLQGDGLHLTKRLTDEAFTTLYSRGNLQGVTLTNTVQMVLDRGHGVFRSVSFHELTDVMDENPMLIDPDTLGGIAIWGTSRSTGWLQLRAVENTPTQVTAQTAHLVYERAGLGADLGEIPELTYGINMDTLDLDAELDAYATAVGDDLAAYVRMRQIMVVDGRNPATAVVLPAIANRLSNSLANEPITNRYIDLLGNDGSPDAQALLRRLIDPADPLFAQASAGSKEQVFANLALLEEPQPETYNLIQALISNPALTPDEQHMALLAWGTFGRALADRNPGMATTIYGDLSSRLSTAVSPEQTRLLLLALGNTGHPNLLTLINTYLPTTNQDTDERVQMAAYWALRFVPGNQAESILIQALEDDGGIVKPLPKEGAAIALKNRPGKPSDAAKTALAGYYGDPPQPGGAFYRAWDKAIGGKRFGGNLPGSVVIESVPRIKAHATQQANYFIDIPKFDFYRSGTLATANVWSLPVNDNVQQFGYNYQVFNQNVKEVQYNVACADADGGPIRQGHLDLYELDFSYPVWWILKVGVKLEAAAIYNLSYEYEWEVCNPINLTAEIRAIGDAKVHVSAFGYGQVWPVRGGPKLAADVIHAELTARSSGTYTVQDGFQACLHVPAYLKAGSGAFSIYAERWKVIKFKWDIAYQYTDPDWNFTLWSGNINIIPRYCIP